MKNINLTKFGFVRSKEDDFTDDGSRFTCYKVGDVRVSKTTYNDEIFIHGRYEGSRLLNYEEYSILPHYKAMNALNGVKKDTITDQDLVNFYNSCLAYDKEYKEAESKIVYPTLDELVQARKAVLNVRKAEFDEVKTMLSNNAEKLLSLDNYNYGLFKTHYRFLQRASDDTGFDKLKDDAKTILGTLYSRYIISRLNNDLMPSYDYKECMSLLKK